MSALTDSSTTSELEPITSDVLRVLVQNHSRFLDFLERRVASREAAEEILQDAFVRSIDKVSSLRDEESAVAWFYRLLRNALVDHYRRSGAERRAVDALAKETDEVQSDEELYGTVCSCLNTLVETLKPEYSTALQRVDLQSVPLRDFAAEAGISPNNAAVRLHRAREALRKRMLQSCGTCAVHGCLDCSCGSSHGCH